MLRYDTAVASTPVSTDSARRLHVDQQEHAFKHEHDKPMGAFERVHSFKLSRDVTQAGDESLCSRIESVDVARQHASTFFDDLHQTMLSTVQSPHVPV